MKTSLKAIVCIFLALALLMPSCKPELENGFEQIFAIEGLNCGNATVSGTFVADKYVAGSSVSIPYTKTNGGPLSQYVVSSTGVSGLSAILEPEILRPGSGALIFKIFGTPVSPGIAKFEVNFARSTCTVQINVAPPVGLISGLNCSAASHSGSLLAGVVSSGVNSSIPYTGGNGGTYTAQTVNSTGVTGLTAILEAGTLASGSGNLNFTISGTPSGPGTASFALNIAGQSCTLTRTVAITTFGMIGTLQCLNAASTGSLVAGVAANGITSIVPYSGGNGGIHNGQTVNSTGVTGLTATLLGGTFAIGSGSLTYSIAGTPSISGTANFVLNIGGRACTLQRLVTSASSNTTIVMKNIPAGTFSMGCTTGDMGCNSDERPVRNVTLSAFQIGETEVTQAQWQEVMGTNSSEFSNCSTCPVVNVTWFYAVFFCNRLSEAQGLKPCYYSDSGFTKVYGKSGSGWTLLNAGTVFRDPSAEGYRLPTEAEWEYAARGGNNSHIYSGSNNVGNVAWYDVNSGNKTQPIKGKQANGYGLYDMSGNVFEWCQDLYAVYPSLPQTNPSGPNAGDLRVVRGGSYGYNSWYCRVSYRFGMNPSYVLSNGNGGFRVVRQL